jgi:ribosomal protein S6--L-glutamate ligase
LVLIVKIAIISGGNGWHARDLQRAAALLGHVAEAIDFRQVQASIPNRNTLSDYDAVIVRTMPPGSLEQVVFRMDVLHQLESAGRRVLNPPRALEICVDKYLASARLDAAGLPTPPTIVCQDAEAAIAAFHQLGGDVVVKPLFGSEGKGMVRVSDIEIAWRVFRTLERLQNILYVQQFIRHPGWDLRVFVIDNRVLTAMRRHARDDWRTNVAQGGRTEPITLSAEEEQLALAAAAAVGAPIAGVDLLPRPDGGYDVLEVNAVPGWRALAPATGVDVGCAIMRFAVGSAVNPPQVPCRK